MVGVVSLQRADTRFETLMSVFDPIFIVNGCDLDPLAGHHDRLAIHFQRRRLDRLPAHGDVDGTACHGLALFPVRSTAEGGAIRTCAA